MLPMLPNHDMTLLGHCYDVTKVRNDVVLVSG